MLDLKSIVRFILSRDEPELEKRLFIVSIIIGILVCITGSVINLHLKLHWILNAITVLGITMQLFIYYLARWYNRFLVWEFIFVTLIVLNGTWIYNEGYNGSINYLYMLALLVYLGILKRKHHILVMLLVFTNLITLHLFQYYLPEIIQVYPTEKIRQSDIIFTFTYSLFFAGLVYSNLRLNYEQEKNKVTAQKKQIEQQHRAIKDSILYAEHIQKATLKSEFQLKSYLKDCFLLWQPKDTIGSDFYLVESHPSNKDIVYVIVGDCTGHGVPGTLLSMLAISLFKEVVQYNPEYTAADILNVVRDKFLHQLKRYDSSENYDGMDVGICKVDKKESNVQYSGANRPLFLLRSRELVEFKSDRSLIGLHVSYKEFSNTDINLESNDIFILTTDGFADQYGESTNQKYLVSRFKEKLVNMAKMPYEIHKEYIGNELREWQGAEEQTDDILVFSFIPI